jgi:hypothetical protein
MGDGSTVLLTRDEIRREIAEGSEAAAAKAKIPILEENEVDYLVDMFCCPSRVWGVERGHEAVMTKDGGTNTLISSRLSSGIAAPIGRETAVRLFERAFAFDSMEVGHIDYSVKPSKFIVSVEQEHMELLQHTTVFPLFYGFMPNLGLYYRPDGQFENPSDLLPLGKIDEARRTQEEALELGRQIAMKGRESFVREFRKSLGKVKPQRQQSGIQHWSTPAQYSLLVAVLALCLFGLASMPAREWIRLLVLMVMVMGIYGISSWFAYRRFCKWVDYLIANYATHVARGGQ